METSQIILCDTNILIEFYKQNSKVIRNLRAIGQENMAISIVTVSELLFGALNKKELDQIKQDLAHLREIHLNQESGERFTQLMIQYSLSHKLSLPDGLIASIALTENISLYTHNTRDFKFIKGLALYTEQEA
jgi:tRNA(fMet)-specific endonuclease VapC